MSKNEGASSGDSTEPQSSSSSAAARGAWHEAFAFDAATESSADAGAEAEAFDFGADIQKKIDPSVLLAAQDDVAFGAEVRDGDWHMVFV